MPRLPAFCESCGAVFASPLEAGRPGAENAFGVPVPCPACEGGGRVPGEVLSLSATAARLFAETEPAGAEAFLRVLAEAGGRQEGPEEELLVETARRAPAFVELARRLPADRPGMLAGMERLLRRVREHVRRGEGREPSPGAGPGQEDDPGSTGGDQAAGGDRETAAERAAVAAVEELLDEEAVQPETPDVPEELARARTRLKEAGRNDPCPCGSGDKYKDCHWVPDLRTTRA